MKRMILLTVSALALAACGGTKQAKLQGLCSGILEGDPEAVRELASDNTSVRPFCECYAKTAVAGGDDVLKLHTDVWSALSDTLQNTEATDINSAAEALETELRSGTSTYAFDEAAFDAVGDYLESIADQFEENGACAL